MNLVEVATWIQDGYREAYDNFEDLPNGVQNYVFRYVMQAGKGCLNPSIVKSLVQLETSVPDQHGTTQC
jgi:hypothetical protein